MTRSSSSAATNEGARIVREFTRDLAGEIVGVVAPGVVVGVYLHGSAVLGDWNARVSDVDVLVVVADAVASRDAEHVAAVLSNRAGPGVGLEAWWKGLPRQLPPRRGPMSSTSPPLLTIAKPCGESRVVATTT